MAFVASFLCGLVFSAGLMISGMVRTEKVLGFLDVFGDWDPSLAFVMVAALAVAAPGFALLRRRDRPMFSRAMIWPTQTVIDRPLVFGSALFGIGWGLVGLCPGPAIENLASLSPQVLVFVTAMVAGVFLRDVLNARRRGRATSGEPAAAAADG